jgi:UDP-N-acetylmuramate dehydrogenase
MDWKGIRGTILENAPMRRYTSMRAGGPVRYLVYPIDEADLLAAVKRLKEAGVGYRFLGNGTNIVVDDRGLDEALIRLTRLKMLRYTRMGDTTLVDVSGGFPLKRLIEENCRRGLSGLEKLYWIPGSVGGAVTMNAGSFGVSISQSIQRVVVLNEEGGLDFLDDREMCFGYRTSAVKSRQCVLWARFGLVTGDAEEIRTHMDKVYAERKKRHPMEYPSAGSVFKGVDGEPAWKFIEKAGLRGFRIGDACVSEKHANFIVNLGHARASDIKALVESIKIKVFERTGAILEEEIEFWGFCE